jgi:hypothetical protein
MLPASTFYRCKSPLIKQYRLPLSESYNYLHTAIMRWIELILNYTFVIIAIGIFLKSHSKIPAHIRLIGYIVIVTAAIELVAAVLLFKDINNLFLFHILNPLQFFVYSIYLKGVLKNPILKKYILYSSAVLVFFSAFLSWRIQPVNEYNSYWLLIQNSVLCLYLLFFFYEEILDNAGEKIYSKSVLFINIGLFVYSISNLFIGGFLNTLIKNNVSAALIVYFASVIVSYFTYTCYIIAFRKIDRS